MIAVVGFLLVSSVLTAIEQHDPIAGLKELGDNLIFSSQELKTNSDDIYEQGAAFKSTGNLGKDIFNTLYKYYALLSNLFIVLLWIKVFSWIISVSPFSNASAVFTNVGLGLLIYIAIQSIVLLIFSEGDKIQLALSPIYCLWSFIRIIPILMMPFRK